MNNSINIPHGLFKQKKENKNLLAVIKDLFPSGTDLSNLSNGQISEALNGRITTLENKVATLELQLAKTMPITERFNFGTPRLNFVVNNEININAPISFIYESLPQKFNIDFCINTTDKNQVDWINTSDVLEGYVEFTYYKL